MKYVHPTERAIEYAERALEFILKEQLPPNPTIFELFYCYYSKDETDVVRAIDIMKAGGYDMTPERCYELYARFLNPAIRAESSVERAGQIMHDTIESVSEINSSIKANTKRVQKSTVEASKGAQQAKSEEDLMEVVAKVISESQKIVEENKSLEEHLSHSMAVMQKLHAELETIRAEALTDALTGAPNRKIFDLEISRLTDDAALHNTPMVLLMLDIDHFKNFNDTYGHQTGDQVLRFVSRVLKDNIKGRDVYARYGGEEFAVILPNTFLTDAVNLANKLREAIAAKEILNRSTGENMGHVTLSIGAAQLGKDETPTSLIKRADAALYRAKRAGRNQVIAADTYIAKKEVKIPH